MTSRGAAHRTALVTGGTRGIGLEVVRGLAVAGYRVIAVGRDPESGRRAGESLGHAADQVSFLFADLASRAGVRTLAASVVAQAPGLDLLVHNAAVVRPTRELTPDGDEWQWAVNHLAPFLLTSLLFPALARSTAGRVVITASQVERGGTINFDDLTLAHGYTPASAYGRSKLANVLFCYELARRIDGSGVTANCLHPGVVLTGLLKTLQDVRRKQSDSFAALGRVRSALGKALRVAGLRKQSVDWALSPADGAKTTLFVATSADLAGISGRYFRDGHAAESSAGSRDPNTAKRLWEVSAATVGIPADWPLAYGRPGPDASHVP